MQVLCNKIHVPHGFNNQRLIDLVWSFMKQNLQKIQPNNKEKVLIKVIIYRDGR